MNLKLDDIHAYYGDYHVLNGISFEVGANDIVAYLGRNGTGKTTTFKVITGLVEPRQGTVTLNGNVVNTLPTYEIGRNGVSFVLADKKVFPHLTVKENIQLPTLERSIEPDFEVLYDLFPDLAEYEKIKAGNLSGGQQQMVALAQGLAPDPELLLLDEPVQGLAVEFVDRVSNLLERLRGDVAIMLIEHDIELALSVADYVLIIDEGEIVWRGASEELREDEAVINHYIGVSGFAE